MSLAADKMARAVSVLAHPFVMIVLMVVIGTRKAGRPGDINSNVAVVSLFAVLPVAILTIRQVRRGAWMNVDASHPRERPALYLVGIAGVLALVLFLLLEKPDSILLRGSLVALALLVVCAITNRWTKVSLHVAAAALTATALIFVGSAAGWVVLGILPFLAWSRYALGRHSVFEIALGIIFGSLAGLAMHWLRR
jgi:hypothetical protein